MKKLLLIPMLFMYIISLQSCSDDEVAPHADGHIHGEVVWHDEVADVHHPVAGATVEMWLNESSAVGSADFSTTSNALGAYEFEELESGVYFIHAFGMDINGDFREGSALVTIDEVNHEVEVEIEVE